MPYSEPGKGTTFRIYFPCSEASAMAVQEQSQEQAGPTGTETILVVEDEQIVRELVSGILKSGGYTVIEAGDGTTAEGAAAAHAGEIHLMVTDIMLPDTDGISLYKKISGARPVMRSLYMSGYTPDLVKHTLLVENDSIFIQKPFSLSDFSRKVRAVLDQGAGKPRA
jgi:DNA-binding response OmpR family regulator